MTTSGQAGDYEQWSSAGTTKGHMLVVGLTPDMERRICEVL